MKKKYLIFSAALLLTFAAASGQDTSKLSAGKYLKNNSDTLHTTVDPNARVISPPQAPGAPHAEVNSNRGTVIPNTTTGTLNSTVNPNTEFVIPLHKSKRKSSSNVRDSGIIIPKQ